MGENLEVVSNCSCMFHLCPAAGTKRTASREPPPRIVCMIRFSYRYLMHQTRHPLSLPTSTTSCFFQQHMDKSDNIAASPSSRQFPVRNQTTPASNAPVSSLPTH